MDFVAIDFETATSVRTSACSIGICEVADNRIAARRSTLIRPVPFEFNEYNTMIHGITPEMVFDKPNFGELWHHIKPLLDGKLVVAHNASFDINVLLSTLDYFGIEYPTFDYICTVKLSQKAYPDLFSHKLNALADAFGICFSHHDACDDAYVCARVLMQITEDFKIKTLAELEEKFDIGIGHVYPGYKEPCRKNRKKQKK
ncbi:MAG: 3'-5' exonuclease [Clostridia bacterium]|nr:3'-5' exonuclease [Clostridia bacterium]